MNNERLRTTLEGTGLTGSMAVLFALMASEARADSPFVSGVLTAAALFSAARTGYNLGSTERDGRDTSPRAESID